jgi:hypothetical protein
MKHAERPRPVFVVAEQGKRKWTADAAFAMMFEALKVNLVGPSAAHRGIAESRMVSRRDDRSNPAASCNRHRESKRPLLGWQQV